MTYPPIQETFPEVFILESLSLEDERRGRYEGKVLAETLKMCGKSPEYYYFRTEEELIELAKEFRKSGYRFLHLSCHGSHSEIATTFGSISYQRFAEIFSGFLQNRRLFVSACEVGNELFSSMISAKNKGMYSIASPSIKIRFDVSVALWSSLYVKTFLADEDFIKGTNIYLSLVYLCEFFEAPFHWSWYKARENKWIHQTIEGNPSIKPKTQAQKAATREAEQQESSMHPLTTALIEAS